MGQCVQKWRSCLAAVGLLACVPGALSQGRVTLAWDANNEPDLAGYKVYYGTHSRTYALVVDAGNVTTVGISNLQDGVTYYFAATAYNTAGLESDFSAEVSHTVSPRIATTGTISSSANPARPGATVVFSFRVEGTAATSPVPSGSVVLRVGGTASVVDLVDGTATLAVSNLAAGAHAATAEYAGDMNFLGVTNRLTPDQVINTPPIAGADQVHRILPNSVKVQAGILLRNDTDGDGHALTLSGVSSQSSNGASVTRRSSWIYYVAPEGMTNADSFTYTVSDGLGGIVTGTVNVRIADPQPTANVTVSEDGGSYRVRFDGTPEVAYRIDFTETDPPSWQTLGTRTADEFGIFEIVDTPPTGSAPRTYRSVAIY